MRRSERVVVCIKVGNKYGADYVNTLYHMVQRHTTALHHFICLTDDPAGLQCPWRPINVPYPGWWAKMVLFKPHTALIDKRVVFIDLDTVIVDNIDFLFEYSGEFCILKDWWAPGYNSSVMSIAPWFNRRQYIWDKFTLNAEDVMHSMHGDQDFLNQIIPDADIWNMRLIGSYKANGLHGSAHGYRIICFHGQPKPHEISGGWVREHWR